MFNGPVLKCTLAERCVGGLAAGGKHLVVKTQAANLSLDRVSRASGVGPLAFNSRVSGPLELTATLAAEAFAILWRWRN